MHFIQNFLFHDFLCHSVCLSCILNSPQPVRSTRLALSCLSILSYCACPTCLSRPEYATWVNSSCPVLPVDILLLRLSYLPCLAQNVLVVVVVIQFIIEDNTSCYITITFFLLKLRTEHITTIQYYYNPSPRYPHHNSSLVIQPLDIHRIFPSQKDPHFRNKKTTQIIRTVRRYYFQHFRHEFSAQCYKTTYFHIPVLKKRHKFSVQ